MARNFIKDQRNLFFIFQKLFKSRVDIVKYFFVIKMKTKTWKDRPYLVDSEWRVVLFYNAIILKW